MKDFPFLFRSFTPTLLTLPVLSLAALMMLLFGAKPHTELPQSNASSFTTFDAPGAGAMASALEGTAAFGINSAGEIAGFYTDTNNVNHGYVRDASGAISEFNAQGAGAYYNEGTQALSIDAGGDVTGPYKDSNDVFHGYVRAANGVITTFDISGAGTYGNQGTTPFSINDYGEITGFYADTNGVMHGFLRAANGTITTIDVPGEGTSKGYGTRAFGINNAGVITGFYADANGVFHGFIRSAGGAITTFDAAGAGTHRFLGTLPFGMDANGDVTGLYVDSKDVCHGFVRASDGTISEFDAPGAGTSFLQGTFPFSINSSGVIAGLVLDAKSVAHGFMRTTGGTVTTFDVPGAGSSMGPDGGYAAIEGSSGFSINEEGAIAGSYMDANSVIHGFVYEPALTTVTPTVTVVPAASSITTSQALNVTITVSGGSPTPTGSVTLASSDYSSAVTALNNGSATITIPAGSLALGSDTLTASYSGDSVYSPTAGAASVTVTALPQAATPVFSVSAGTYNTPQMVTITDSTSGAAIYYTTNGTAPGISSTRYSGAITVSASETLEAIAVASGYSNSAIASAAYNIHPATNSELRFVTVTPCRIADTRNAVGPFGGPELTAGGTRTFDVPQSACGIPSTAVAYSLNVTVVPNVSLDYLTLWPAGQTRPFVSTLNSDGRIKANASIMSAGANGGVSVYVTDETQVILDIDGYFVPAATPSSLEFYPLTPCRVADTRQTAGALGGPSLGAGASRAFPVRSSACDIPSTAQAYSLNVTAIPHKTLDYLTAWNTGGTQPNVSTLNSSTGAVTANAAIVPAGSGGEVSIFVSDAADVILDVNGYFAPPATGGLSLYTVEPCRVIDTRSGAGAFNGVLTVDFNTSVCTPPFAAQAYVVNATVVPAGALNYLTLWPNGEAQPNVSTLNAGDGAITSNMAIVPNGNGSIDAYSSNPTNLILDLSSYFAP